MTGSVMPELTDQEAMFLRLYDLYALTLSEDYLSRYDDATKAAMIDNLQERGLLDPGHIYGKDDIWFPSVTSKGAAALSNYRQQSAVSTMLDELVKDDRK